MKAIVEATLAVTMDRVTEETGRLTWLRGVMYGSIIVLIQSNRSFPVAQTPAATSGAVFAVASIKPDAPREVWCRRAP